MMEWLGANCRLRSFDLHRVHYATYWLAERVLLLDRRLMARRVLVMERWALRYLLDPWCKSPPPYGLAQFTDVQEYRMRDRLPGLAHANPWLRQRNRRTVLGRDSPCREGRLTG